MKIKEKLFNNKKIVATLVAVIVYSVILIQIVQAVTETPAAAEPGSDANPLVSQDYVDAKVKESTAKLDELTKEQTTLKNSIADLTANLEALKKETQDTVGKSLKYEILKFTAGEQVIAGAGSEIVIRSGRATAIAGGTGGVADVTAGIDLQTGTVIAKNHLLLIPLDDGRGFKAESECWVLIKGPYTKK